MNSRISTDSLMQCLVTLTKLNNRPVSAETLSHNLPFDPKEDKQRLFSIDKPKSNFSRAALKAGFKSKLLKRNLKDIPRVVLPVILILKDDQACVLTKISFRKKVCEIIIPSVDDKPATIELEKLEEEYLGYCFFMKKQYQGFSDNKEDIKKRSKGHWFFGTMMMFKGIYTRVLLGTLLVNIFVVAGPLFTMNVYDRIIPHNAVDTLWVLASGITLVYFFDFILKLLRTNFLENAAKKSDIILSSMLFEQAMNLTMKDKPRSVGSFTSNIKDFDSVRSFFTSSAVTAFIEVPFAIIFLIVIYSINPNIAKIPMIVICLILLVSISMKNPIYRLIEKTHEASAKRNGILVEALSNIDTIKAFNAASTMQWHWEESTGDIASKSLKSRIRSNILSTFTVFLTQFSSVAIIVYGVYLIKEGELSMGGLIAVNMLSSRTIAPMSQVVALLSSFDQMKAGLKSLNDLMAKDIERPETKKFLRRPKFTGAVEFNDVSFTYPDEHKTALKNINFKINSGEKVGIIGSVGSGKSTLSKIILGFYPVDEGSVFLDGIDIKQIDPVDLRHNISYVPQDVVLFSGTVRDNITLKSPHAEDHEIIEAAKIGGVNIFTDRHPLGMDMQTGERGFNLSGGQRQSVAVARAFLDTCPLAVLDEPTNSMDFNSEINIIKNLKKITHNKTAIVITHKPAILEIVDRIIVMDNGSIAMDGPKDEIIARLGGKNQ